MTSPISDIPQGYTTWVDYYKAHPNEAPNPRHISLDELKEIRKDYVSSHQHSYIVTQWQFGNLESKVYRLPGNEFIKDVPYSPGDSQHATGLKAMKFVCGICMEPWEP